MSFLRSAIPILSFLNDECELLIESLEMSSIIYPKFSPKTMELALKQLKQELENNENGNIKKDKKKVLSKLNEKNFMKWASKMKESILKQKDHIAFLIDDEKKQKSSESLKNFLNQMNLDQIQKENEEKIEKNNQKTSFQTQKQQKDENWDKNILQQTLQQMGYLDQESAYFFR